MWNEPVIASFNAAQFLYMAPAIDIMDGRGLSNKHIINAKEGTIFAVIFIVEDATTVV